MIASAHVSAPQVGLSEAATGKGARDLSLPQRRLLSPEPAKGVAAFASDNPLRRRRFLVSLAIGPTFRPTRRIGTWRTFRNGAVDVKHRSRDLQAQHGRSNIEHRHLPEIVSQALSMAVAWRKRVIDSPARHEEGISIPEVSVARLSLPSVVGAAAANVMPGPRRYPSANLAGVLERDHSVRRQGPPRASSGTASRREDTGGSPPSGAALSSSPC